MHRTDKIGSDLIGELAENIFTNPEILEKIKEHERNMEKLRKFILNLIRRIKKIKKKK